MPAPHVNPDAIRRTAEGWGFERGLEYFRDGAVIAVRWEPGEHAILARVSGSGSQVYHCTITLDAARTSQPIMRTTCSCPLRSGCKHVVASLFASNAMTTPTEAVASPPARPTAKGMTAARLPPSWRSLLSTPADDLAPTGALALGVELRQRQAQDAARWEPRRLMAVTAQSMRADALSGTRSDLLLSVRPLMRSPQTGKWIKGHASWDVARRPGGPFPPAQVRWFAEMYSIARDVFSIGTFTDASEWLTLDTVASGLLWQHLRAADALGIPFVAIQDSLTVTVHGGAMAEIEIAPTPHGGLDVAARITIDAMPVDPASVRAISRSGVYALEVSTDRIEVMLAPVALSEPMQVLLAAGGRLEVPAADAEEFLRTVTPRLSRQTTVRTVDGLEMPTAVAPVLVLNVAFRAGDTVEFSFVCDYDGIARFPVILDAPEPRTLEPDRDGEAEAALWARAAPAWERATALAPTPAGTLRGVVAAEFMARVVPSLQRRGVRLQTSGTRPRYRELLGDPEISVSTVESTDPDWFDLGVIVTIGGRTIPFTPLFTALSRRQPKILLSDGAYFSLSHPALDRLRELVSEAAELTEWEAGPKISKYQTALWADFEDLADESAPAQTWRQTAESLRDVERIEHTPAPSGLLAHLRPYQQSGFDWLAFLWRHRLGGILADDMGLGKTLQMLALIVHTRESGERKPFLVVAPTSVTTTWRDEAARFAPELRVSAVDGTRGKRDRSVAETAAHADVVVTSYGVLRLAEDEFTEVQWAGLVLDEAQFVKNPQTKLYRAVRDVRADVTFAITGTPLENSLTDLWSLLSLTAPGLFASARRFREEYVGPIEKGKVPENEEGGPFRARRLARLRSRIRPLMLRRTKEVVAAELPPKQEQHLRIELSPAHRALYDIVLQRERQKVLGLLDELDRNRFIVFRSLTLLRMLALSPGLVDPEHAHIESSKLDVLAEQLGELIAEGHRALVFSQFTSYLEQVSARLRREGIDYSSLDGSSRNRGQIIDEFRTGTAPVFLISLKAGGFGLTLTEADYVFLLDPWWNPAAEAQAVDRTHRIGQTNAVMVYRMIATGTIEEKVMALQERKARLFQAVMDEDAVFSQTLTADDIRGLLDG